MSILLTGAAGYIGSHIAVELLNRGEDIVIVDNFYNSSEKVLDRIEEITGREFSFYEIDVKDEVALEAVFDEEDIEAVIHLAGYKAVGESVAKPLSYYENNIMSTVSLCKVMKNHNVNKLIFSSSATVYGQVDEMPITEKTAKGICTNPYGWTKWMIEQMLMDIQGSDKDFSLVILRYFNPIGAHESGLIGEDPNGIPNNLSPYITQVAIGKLDKLRIFGDDYHTPDGTGVRDYIHVVDLAKGHVKALDKMRKESGLFIYNLGTGKGVSVLDMVRSFERATGKAIPYEIVERRAGDIDMLYCDTSLAEKELAWKAEYDLDKMCQDSWRWQCQNPNGYRD